MKYATQKRVLLEVTLIKLCRPSMDSGKDALLDRIRAIEKQLEEGLPKRPVRHAADAGERESRQEEIIRQKLPKALSEDIREVVKDFRAIAGEASPMLKIYLKKARLSAGEDNRLLIVVPDEMSAGVVGSEEHKKEIEELIEQKVAKSVEIEVRQMEEGRRFEDHFVDIENLINMEITVED